LARHGTPQVHVEIDTLLQDFLAAIEWDLRSANPSPRRLTELSLDDVAEDLM